VIVIATGTANAAQPVSSSQPADLCVRRAAAIAFGEVTARLLRLPMTERETVGQWIGSRTPVDLAMRQAAYQLRQVKIVSPDNADVCRVEVSLIVSEMARTWARRLRQESLASVEELEQIREWSSRAEQGRLSATGTADRVAGPALISAPSEGATSQPAMPPGWEHLPIEALGFARRAAAADAAERMRARCRELRLATGESLGDVFDLYGTFEDAFLKQMQRRLDAQPIYEPFGVCRLPARLSLKEIAEVLSRAAADTPAEVGLPRVDLTQLADPAQRKAIAVEGVGVPPTPRLAWPGQSPADEVPAWATETLTAVGQSPAGTDASTGTDATGQREAAIRRARLDAIRNMWLQVDELTLPDGRRARDAILAHPELADELAALENRMTDASAPEIDTEGRASVKIVMPLGPLWDTLSHTAARPRLPAPATRPSREPTSRTVMPLVPKTDGSDE
jgi:hypothetical protein